MPEKPFVIFEEDFVKTMMDYEFYSKGIDVKDFGNSFLQCVLYSSSVTADGDINFIGSSANNNGVTNKIGNKDNIHPGNLITVSYNGSVGEAFYQENQFVASDDVNVLYPKFELNKYIAWYLCPIIRKVCKNFAFIDKWKKEDMEKSKIKLPVDSNEMPDWSYMESYMKAIEQKVLITLKEYCTISEMKKKKHNKETAKILFLIYGIGNSLTNKALW